MTPAPTAADVVRGMDLASHTVVITGASSGLGRESARALAGAGAHVILAARNEVASDKTVATIRTLVSSARLSTVILDLASLASVRSAAAQIASITATVNVLMNNAGVMFTPYGRTADGFEIQFGTNHLGHFELTRLLTPLLRSADGARIVNLSSDGHRLGDIDFTDPNWERCEYDKFRAYGASKTANCLHAVALDRTLVDDGIRAFAVHPGMVATKLARHMDRQDVETVAAMATPSEAGSTSVLSPAEGAATQVWAAVSPELSAVGGLYLLRPEKVGRGCAC